MDVLNGGPTRPVMRFRRGILPSWLTKPGHELIREEPPEYYVRRRGDRLSDLIPTPAELVATEQLIEETEQLIAGIRVRTTTAVPPGAIILVPPGTHGPGPLWTLLNVE